MKNDELVCPICGESTSVYMGNARKDRLCRKHALMAKAGQIVLCPNCGKWHDADKPCDCNKLNNEHKPSWIHSEKVLYECPKCGKYHNLNEQCIYNNQTEQQNNKKCLLCNNESGEYIFCKSCFAKYKNKTLLLKITVDKNQKLELLDESYEGLYVCKDGHVVKSKSERDIDNYLFEHKIAHAYEKALVIGSETFHPDFYLPEYDLYLEHWGYDENNIEYTKRKEYKLPKYKEKGITLISTYEKDMKDVDTSLEIKLNSYKKGELNFIE